MTKSDEREVKLGGMRMTTVGVVVDAAITQAAIEGGLDLMDYYQAGMNWCVGDLLLLGAREFGDDWMLQAASTRLKSMSPETQRQCELVSRRFPIETRVNMLTWSHHLAVVGIRDEMERAAMLESCLEPTEDAPGRSQDKPMGLTDLRRAVRAAKVGDDEPEKSATSNPLEDAENAILRLGYAERVQIAEWMEGNMDAWARMAMEESGHGADNKKGDCDETSCRE